jgi:hypothetical protein
VDIQELMERMRLAQTPGRQVTFTQAQAEMLGAFREDALSEEDALASMAQLEDAQLTGSSEDAPAFITGKALGELPTYTTTRTSRDIFGKRPGESLIDALERRKSEGRK